VTTADREAECGWDRGASGCPARMGGDLVADRLSCRRGERLVFFGLSFRLAAGGALLVSGPNGSGKSSLLRLLATLILPIGGRLLWAGAPVEGDLATYRASLRYVGHQDAVKPALTARETLALSAALHGVRQEGAAVEKALAAFALEGIADWPGRWLSAGQRRRLALSRLIVAPAPLWLLDEPFASLDADNQRRLEEAIATHRQGGGSLVLATHLEAALPGADRIELGRR
jgi:heme exporter protein A